MSLRSVFISAVPLAAAIGIFGVVFGAAAGARFGPTLTLAMSLLVFSGTVQFAVLGLVAAGAGAPAILLTVLALNSRNLVLGAVLRPRLEVSTRRRALLGWFLIDESLGLALAARRQAAFVLLVAGLVCYLGWLLGTVIGVAGGRFAALEEIAAAIFPVLFIGLAAITAGGRGGALRAAAAVLIVGGLTLAVPAAHAFLPILAAVAVALPGRRPA